MKNENILLLSIIGVVIAVVVIIVMTPDSTDRVIDGHRYINIGGTTWIHDPKCIEGDDLMKKYNLR